MQGDLARQFLHHGLPGARPERVELGAGAAHQEGVPGGGPGGAGHGEWGGAGHWQGLLQAGQQGDYCEICE